MRLRAVFLLAFAMSLLDAAWTRFAADPPPPITYTDVGWITPISTEDTNCPVATARKSALAVSFCRIGMVLSTIGSDSPHIESDSPACAPPK
jgi:hypothetical protein